MIQRGAAINIKRVDPGDNRWWVFGDPPDDENGISLSRLDVAAGSN